MKKMKQATPAPSRAQRFFVKTQLEGSGGGANRSHDFSVYDAGLVQASPENAETLPARKIIRNGSLELLVNDVRQSITKIGTLVTAAGGYVEKSAQTNSGGRFANLTIRVPAARLDQVMAEVKGLATTVDREGVEVRDVTHEYIDLDR